MRLINAAPSYKTKKSIQRIYSLSMELAKELRTLQNDLPTFSAREDPDEIYDRWIKYYYAIISVQAWCKIIEDVRETSKSIY